MGHANSWLNVNDSGCHAGPYNYNLSKRTAYTYYTRVNNGTMLRQRGELGSDFSSFRPSVRHNF